MYVRTSGGECGMHVLRILNAGLKLANRTRHATECMLCARIGVRCDTMYVRAGAIPEVGNLNRFRVWYNI